MLGMRDLERGRRMGMPASGLGRPAVGAAATNARKSRGNKALMFFFRRIINL